MNTRSSAPGRRAVAADALRNRLLDAAERLLAERRPGAITSRDLARAAGVSDGVLYNHFADKHDLLLTALVRRFSRLVEAWSAAPPADPGGSPSDGIRDLVRHAHAIQVAALPMLANLVGDPPLFERFLTEIHRPPLGGDVFRRPVIAHLAAEQARGRLGAFDPEAAAEVLVGAVLMQGLIDVLGHRPPAERDRQLDAIAATILSGLSPVEPATPPTTETRRRTR
jgi:AcrR family transcriptional regulator